MIFKRILKNKEKAKRFSHFVAGFTILIHSYAHFEEGHKTYLIFLISGILFLSVAILHSKIEKKAPWIDGLFFIIEGLLSFVVAFEYFHLGKKALPLIYLIVGILQFFLAIKFSKKGIKKHRING